ncbi:uncharacterized protein LOC125238051 [Leguminivora glycinivorella]|uniref:uncharacterized protein LOC125238051 n=1 Tax=Leguminivora glycinivorella TaxID=1035111 RepID=UPI00200C113E|nr:uncharacterized protein LOC125238051 [Leguminivora glycinivorella]
MSYVRQILCTVIVCWLCMNTGVTFTLPSSTLELFASANTTLHRPMTEMEQALFGSLTSIGALVSTPAAGFLIDMIGRKYSVTLFSVMHLLAWIMIAVSNRVEVLLAAIFLSGIGGAGFLVVPIYVSEFCEETIRGGVASASVIFYAIGMALSYALGGYMEYYSMVYTCLALAVLGVLLLSILKESPLYLMKKGKEQEAAKAVAFFRATKVSSKTVQQELLTIRRILDAAKLETDTPAEECKLGATFTENPVQKFSTIQFVRKSYSTRRALMVTLTLATASVFQGLVVVQVYAETLFSKAIPSMSATISSIVFSIITLASGLVAAYYTDAAGRKVLMQYASLASGVCCLLLGSQIHVSWAPDVMTAVVIYTFCVAYSFGAATIPFVLSAEVFLPEVKGVLSMLVIEWTWFCSFVVLFIFNPLVAAIGLGQIFYLFAVVCFATSVFTYYCLPETKGLPVDVIQTLFERRRTCPEKPQATVVCYIRMSFVITFSWPAFTSSLFKSEATPLHRPMSGFESALFGSTVSIGALVGTPIMGILLDLLGRKKCMLLSAVAHVVTWVVIVLCNRVEALLAAMFLAGCSIGSFLVIPVYIAEVCQPALRGAMASCMLLAYGIGMLLSFLLGGYLQYTPMCYVCLIIAVLGAALTLLLKESPVYLMKKEREEDAINAVAYYRNTTKDSKDVMQEVDNIRKMLGKAEAVPTKEEESQKTVERSFWQLLKRPSTRKALSLVLTLLTCSIFHGYVAVCVYAGDLFGAAVPSVSPVLCSVLMALVSIAANLLSAYLIDVLGRRPLMLWSSLGSGLCCVLLGSQIQLQWAPPVATAVVILVFCFIYTVGAGAVPFVVAAEVFLPEVSSILSMLAYELTWASTFAILFAFGPLASALGLGGLFYLFAVVCFATVGYAAYCLPETKGLTVDAIQELF